MTAFKQWQYGRLKDLHCIILELINTSENEEERDFLESCAFFVEKKLKEFKE